MKKYRVEYSIGSGGKLLYKDYDNFSDAFEKVTQLYQDVDKKSCWAIEDYKSIKILQWNEQTERYLDIR